MELKINTNIKAVNKAANKSAAKSSGNFSKALEISKEIMSSKDPLGNLSKKGLQAVSRLEHLLHLKSPITNDNFKIDGYLDIMPILRENSENIKPPDEKLIRDTLLSAVQSDVISLNDYYTAIQWLDMRAKQRQLEGKSEEEMLKVIDKCGENSQNVNDSHKLHDSMFSSEE